jgi:hypothetical protein
MFLKQRRKRQPKVIFDVEPWSIGSGYYVIVTMPDVSRSASLKRLLQKPRLGAGLKMNPSLGCMNARGPRKNRQP